MVRQGWLISPLLLCCSFLAAQEHIVTKSDCSYSSNPDEFLLRESRTRDEAYQRVRRFSQAGLGRQSVGARSGGRSAMSVVPASEIPIRNFVDVEIFSKLQEQNIPSAVLAGEAEFLRRVMLDLTGRPPTAAEVREYLADPSADKQRALIDRLLFSAAFVEKWTMWMGDLLGNAATAQNINQQVQGRNAMHDWIRESIDSQKSLRDVAIESVIARGNNYDSVTAQANFVVRGFTPMGPNEDHYDGTLVRVASAWLGLSHYDCVLCHDGAPRLQAVSAWGNSIKRAEAQKMAAFFSKVNWVRNNVNTDPYFNSVTLTESTDPNRRYGLTSTSGNRPTRVTKDPANPARNLGFYTPVYRDGTVAGASGWREQFAQLLVQDPMFAKNLANRLWKSVFNVGLVEPLDTLDPLRLDSASTPPWPWTHQTPHVVLLEKLADNLRANDYNLREFLRVLVSSSAYQLSSRYDAEFNIERMAYYPRHYPRRLEGEEVHDILVRMSGLTPRYTVGGWAEPVSFAMQLPEPVEPRSNGGVANFLNSFQRGNRDTIQRNQSGSILMNLNLMNNAFVTERVRIAASPGLRQIAALPSNEAVVEELFLTLLSRYPSEAEQAAALKRFGTAANATARNAVIEDLAWVLVNKVEFVFSY